MHDLVKKTSLHKAYFLSLHNIIRNVLERKSSHKLHFYSFKNNYNLYKFDILSNKWHLLK